MEAKLRLFASLGGIVFAVALVMVQGGIYDGFVRSGARGDDRRRFVRRPRRARMREAQTGHVRPIGSQLRAGVRRRVQVGRVDAPDELIEAARAEIAQPIVSCACSGYSAQRSSMTRAALGELRTPTALIWGASDAVTPLAGWQREAEARSNWDVATIEGAGHVPMLESPEAVCRALFASAPGRV